MMRKRTISLSGEKLTTSTNKMNQIHWELTMEWYGLILRITHHLDVIGTHTQLVQIVTSWTKSSVLSKLRVKFQVFTLVCTSGKVSWEVLELALVLTQLLFGMLTMIIGLHLETILRLVVGVNLILSSIKVLLLYVMLVSTIVSIDLNFENDD